MPLLRWAALMSTGTFELLAIWSFLFSCPARAFFVLGVVGKGSPSRPGKKNKIKIITISTKLSRNQYFFRYIAHHYSGLEQFVTQVTRNNHTLDLVFTTHPDLINDINVVPGISDHEAITFKISSPQVFKLANYGIQQGRTEGGFPGVYRGFKKPLWISHYLKH